MPQMQLKHSRYRDLAQALAAPVAALPDERAAGEEGSVMYRALSLLEDVLGLLCIGLALFWIVREVLAVNG